MKIVFIIPAALIIALTVSCKKQRTCTCTDSTTVVRTYPNGSADTDVYTSSYSATAEKQTKKYFRMDNGCYSYTSKTTDNNNGYTEVRTEEVTCTLK